MASTFAPGQCTTDGVKRRPYRQRAHHARAYGASNLVLVAAGPLDHQEVLRLARDLHFQYAANIEWELDEKDPTEGVRRAFQYIKKVLIS